MFMYCKKCGLIKNIKTKDHSCPACEIELEPVPQTYLTNTGLMFASQQAREDFEVFIKTSAEYDNEAHKKCDQIIAEKEELHKEEVAQKVELYKSTRPQKCCPVCHSTSLHKISNLGKVVKVGAFGILGAGDMGKTWKCNSCGCKF